MTDKNFAVKNGLTVNSAVTINSTAFYLNGTFFLNSTSYSGVANNSNYLGGTLASGYQTTAGLASNVATLTSNAANYLGSVPASGYQTTAGLASNVATFTSNNSNYLGGIVAANYLNTTNFNSTVPSLTGAGAYGNWTINITGNANNATYLNGVSASSLNVNSAVNVNGSGNIVANTASIASSMTLGSYTSGGDVNFIVEAQSASYIQLIANNNSTYNGIYSKYSNGSPQWYIGGGGAANYLSFWTQGTNKAAIDYAGTFYIYNGTLDLRSNAVDIYHDGSNMTTSMNRGTNMYWNIPYAGPGVNYFVWEAAGTVKGQMDNDGRFGTVNGFMTKAGIGAAYDLSVFNIDKYTNLYIDSTNYGAIQTSSDYRIKTNIETMTTTALDRIVSIRPVTYTYKETPISPATIADGIIREGFIAHELAEVIPSSVNGAKDDPKQIQSLRLDALCSVMVKAIQELKAEFDEYKAAHP
jgi:Chaperone of endosialidase